MKRYILITGILFSSTTAFSQTPEDALRSSFYSHNGTARYMAIGGTMGSLGGDITATFVNPAGLGFYKTNEFVLTPNFSFTNNKINYRQNSSTSKKNNLAYGTSGWVFGYTNRWDTTKSHAISIAVNKVASFNNQINYSGLNNYSSFAEQFAEEFGKSQLSIDQVLNQNSPLPYGSAVALYTYLIDTVKVGGAYQVKAAPEYILDAGQAIRQQMEMKTAGGINEIALGFAANRKDRLYFGGTIGIPIVTYDQEMSFTESDTSNITNNHFKSFTYTDKFTQRGVGVNLKLGVIFRPQDYLRLGLALHTPTFSMMKEERETTAFTQLENPAGSFNVSSNTFTNGQKGKYSFGQSTAWKVMGSASYVFREIENVKKQRGFISADVEYVTHGSGRFSSLEDSVTETEKAYYKELSKVVDDNYKGAFNFRVGGELKFNTIMGRLGFAWYGNPYEKVMDVKGNRMLLSGGLGYRHKGMFLDLTYVHSITKDVHFPYSLSDRANTYASLKQQRGTVTATLGIKF